MFSLPYVTKLYARQVELCDQLGNFTTANGLDDRFTELYDSD